VLTVGWLLFPWNLLGAGFSAALTQVFNQHSRSVR
jgi:hypothetical protein